MVAVSLDDIVLEDDVKERIRPLFNEAVASGEISFEHDFQWQAYCDVLYALSVLTENAQWYTNRCANETKGTESESRLQQAIEAYFTDLTLFTNETVQKLSENIKNLPRYSPEIQRVLRTLFGAPLDENRKKYISYDFDETYERDRFDYHTKVGISPMILPPLRTYNNWSERLTKITKQSDAFIRLVFQYNIYADELVEIPSLTDREVEEVAALLKQEQGLPVRVLKLLKRKEYRNSQQKDSRVLEAIECANIRIKGYKVIKKVGEGKWRETYKAQYKKDDCYVAIKVRIPFEEVKSLNKENREEYGQEGLSDNEGKNARRLDHFNIVRYFDRGILADGRPYIIEGFVEGETLKDIIIREGMDRSTPSNWDRVGILSQALEGLAYIHQEGYVHRDIKPENVLVAAKGSHVKIGDLELLKKLEDREEITKNHGSNAYCAPELFQHGRLTKRADVFSFGIVMYETFTGEHAFVFDPSERENRAAIARNIANKENYERVMREIEQNTAIPKYFKPLIKGCLFYDPEERFYSDARELLYYFGKAEREQRDYNSGLMMALWIRKRQYETRWMILLDQELKLQPQRPYLARISALKRFFSL